MIDLVSTNTDDVQTQRCAHLLASVISHAIMDAGSPMSDNEKRKHQALGEALTALKWIFDKKTPFEAYAQLIGLNPDAVRDALLSRVMLRRTGDPAMFSDTTRRNLQARYRWTYGS